MKAWSRAQHAQEREAGLYAHHQAEAELISSYLNSKEAVEAAVAAVSSAQHSQQPYGVPIPPPIPPCGAGGEYLEQQHVEQPLPPQRSSSAAASRSRGKRSRHAGTSARNTGDIHYPKYDLGGGSYQHEQQYKYKNPECQYTTKYGEDCHFTTSSKHGGGGSQQQQSCGYNKTWPKQHCTEEFEDHQYLMQDQPPPQQQQQQPPRSKKSRSKHRDRSPQQPQQQQQQQLDYPCFSSREREYLVTTGSTRHYETQKAANDPIPAIEEVGRYIEQAENRAKSVKDIARDLAKDRAILAEGGHPGAEVAGLPPESKPELAVDQQQTIMNPEIIPPPPSMDSTSAVAGPPPTQQQQVNPNLQTFNPQASTKPEVQLQQEHVQYVDNECCQVAVGVSNANQSAANHHPTSNEAVNATSAATMPRSRPGGPQQSATLKKTGTLTAQQMAQFGTLERNMAEVAERSRSARAELQNQNTLDRRSTYGASCDTCDAPLTPASLAGIDHRDLEHRPLTRSVTRATMYDEPPER